MRYQIVSHETAIAFFIVNTPCALDSKLLKVRVPTSTVAGQSYFFSIEYPASVAATTETALKVEPGAYKPCNARLSAGTPVFSLKRFFASCTVRPVSKAFGSNVGYEARARISPLVVSITTAAPPSA